MFRTTLFCCLSLLPATGLAQSVLRLVSDPWCPVACTAGSAHPGYVVELAKAIFEPAGIRVDYREVPFARAEQMVSKGDADGFIGVLKLPKRHDWAFPASPQAISRVCFYTRPESRWQYPPANPAAPLPRIGSIKDYSYGKEIDHWLAQVRPDAISGVDGLARNIRKLSGQRIDVLVEYELVAQYQMHTHKHPLRNAGCSQQADELYLAFSPARPNAPDLALQFERGVHRLRQSGELARILAAYGLRDWAGKPAKNE